MFESDDLYPFRTLFLLWLTLEILQYYEALIEFPLNYALYVVVQRIQVLRARRPYVQGDVIVEIVIHPFLGYLEDMKLCKPQLAGIWSSFAHALYPKPQNSFQHLLILSSTDPSSLRKEVRRHYISHFSDFHNYHNRQKYCVHDCWNIFRASAQPSVIPSLDLLSLIKDFLMREKNQSISGF